MPIVEKITGEAIGAALGEVTGLVDSLHTSGTEKADALAKLKELSDVVPVRFIEAEAKAIDAQARMFAADAASESWITKSWRPILMLEFGFLIGYMVIGPSWGLPTEGMIATLESVPAQLWQVILVGLGVIGAGRSLEKGVKTLTQNGKMPEMPFKTAESKAEAKRQQFLRKQIKRLTKKKDRTQDDNDMLDDFVQEVTES